MFPTKLVGLALALSVFLVAEAKDHANFRRRPVLPQIPVGDAPVVSRNGTELPPYDTLYSFNQLIDHNKPSLGTFQQRYYFTYENYEPGGPIILSTPGEANAQGYQGYLTNRTINGLIAQATNGATIVLEHRFYGLSNPYPDLKVKSLRVHTIQQAIDDLVYFANNVVLPMPKGADVTPDKAPWILVGGSYSGALVEWTMYNKPNVFFAAYSSSGVVQAINEFWQYFEPIREHMPKNCSADVQAVIKHVDTVFKGKNTKAINAIKENFNLTELKQLDDVAGALRNNLWDWQSLQPNSGPGKTFYKFCDALEVKDGVSAGPRGWGVDHALQAWGKFWKDGYLAGLCDEDDVPTCLGTYDPTLDFWTNTEIDNSSRSWFWFVCNEVGYLQGSPPLGHPSLVSSLINGPYDYRQCQMMFPEAFPKAVPPKTTLTNLKYGGWFGTVKNVFYANGDRDPWRDATASAKGTFLLSTPSRPISLSDGFHCSDMSAAQAKVDDTIAKVQSKAISSMTTWLKTWKPRNSGPTWPPKPPTFPFPWKQVTPTVKAKPINAWFKQ